MSDEITTRDAVLEEAALVCEAVLEGYRAKRGEAGAYARLAASECAEDIRALKDKP